LEQLCRYITRPALSDGRGCPCGTRVQVHAIDALGVDHFVSEGLKFDLAG